MKKIADFMESFDTWEDSNEEENIQYEIIPGNENIVFIKTGAGGRLPGYENKYLKMAQRIHEKIGATVISASNPDELPDDADDMADMDEQKIREVVSEQGFKSFKLYFWGTSDGGDHTLKLVKRFPETQKWIGVNSSFTVFEDFVENLQSLPHIEKRLVYGTENDEDNSVLFPGLYKYENDNLKIIMVEGADHSFSGFLPEFIQTIDWLGE